MNTKLFDAPNIGLGRLLSEGNRYLVPHHQRDYSWTQDEVGQLISDIEDAQETSPDYYFVGLMVVMPTGNINEFTILDGQQRIATTLVILSAIRTWLRSHGLDRDADQIQSTFIAQRELGEDELHQRVFLNETNNPAFYTFVVEERPTDEIENTRDELKRHDPNRLLLDSVIYCRSEIARIAHKAGEPKSAAKKLFALVTYLRDGVSVVRLTVPSEADAYTVFETLNDRGLDLTVLDLVKNFLFGKSGNKARLAEVKSRWIQMTAHLSNVRGDDFLKAYWTSRYGRTQKAQLFPQIKKRVIGRDKAIELSQDILTASEHYAALELADDPTWASYSDSSKESLRALRMLRSQSVHPVLLAGLSKLTQREMERLIRLLEVLIVRYQLVGGGRTGLLEIAAARLAAEVFQLKVRTASDAFAALRDIFPSDAQFEEAFTLKQERNNTKAQYLLRGLEIEAQRRQLGTKAPETGPRHLTIEHIFPRASGPDWQTLEQQDSSFLEECTYRLGNLTLLGALNKDLGQKGFAQKKRMFATSDLILTKELASVAEWNRAEVENRQKRLAELAVTAWRFQ